MDRVEIISKVKNMYIMLLYAITKEDINRVNQYLSEELLNRYNEVIKSNIGNNVIQKYGELNVSKVDIVSIDNDLITVSIVAKYMDYKIDRKTKKFVGGEDKRSTHNVVLKVRYNKDNERLVYHCPNCGAVLNINLTSVCSYCGQPVNANKSLYVIENVE